MFWNKQKKNALEKISELKCSYCGGTAFLEGPSGGMSINILCANKDCRHWFNHNTVSNELEDLHTVEDTDEEKEKKEEDRLKEIEEAPKIAYLEGVVAFKNNKSLLSKLESKAYWHRCNGADLYRIVGYLDAMKGLS